MESTYDERLCALAAATPAAAAPRGMLELAAAVALGNDAFVILDNDAPGRPLPEVLQAAVDFLRGTVAAGEWVAMAPGHSVRGILAALGVAAGAPVAISRGPAASSALALERVFLEDFTVLDEVYLALNDLKDGQPPPAANLSRLYWFASGSSEFWREPATAARLAARLAELGIERCERAAADLRFNLCDRAGQLALLLRHGGELLPAGVDPIRLLEQAVAVNPAGLVAAGRLAFAYIMVNEPRRALATALRALERVSSADGGLAAVQLLVLASQAIFAGGQGPTWSSRDVRPFFDRAQRMLDGNRLWSPRALWETRAKEVSDLLESYLNHGFGEDTRIRRQVPTVQLELARRTCAACGARELEMPQCGRCRAARYCSPACQRAHWPAHKAACKAAAAAAASGAR